MRQQEQEAERWQLSYAARSTKNKPEVKWAYKLSKPTPSDTLPVHSKSFTHSAINQYQMSKYMSFWEMFLMQTTVGMFLKCISEKIEVP